jgi:hypothetical protein
MKRMLYLFVFLAAPVLMQAQALFANYKLPLSQHSSYAPPARTLYQRNYGAIVGLQRGNITSVEFGAEMHWRKMSLRSPKITGATANVEYNFGHNELGYKVGVWQKHGRVNLTYGGNVVYYTNFHGARYGIGPAVGFRFAGFHLVNGFNLLTPSKKDEKEFKDVNTLYMTLRYYFPIDNKFTWDRKTMRKKRERHNAREERKAQRAEDRESGKRWNWRKPLDVFKKKGA